jgi:hypothetical protein
VKYLLLLLAAGLVACGPSGPSRADLCRADGGRWVAVGSHTEWRNSFTPGANGQVSVGVYSVEVTDWDCEMPR